MYKVVIIDDNKNTVQSLLHSVDWKSFRTEVVGTAPNGRRGLELIEQTRPDIVITDIRMPNLDGLKMIEMMQKKLGNAKIIIITGYDKFQYASRAIKLSVFDFILKPIDNEELYDAIGRAFEQIEKEREKSVRIEQIHEFSRRALLLSLMTSPGVYDESIQNMLRDCGLEHINWFYIMALRKKNGTIPQSLLQKLDDENIARSCNIISLLSGSDIILFVMLENQSHWRKDALSLSDVLLRNDNEIVIAVSGVHNCAKGIHRAYKEAKQVLLERSLEDDDRRVCFYNDLDLYKNTSLSDLDAVCTCLVNSRLKGQERIDNVYRTVLETTGGEIRLMRTMLVLYCTQMLSKCLAKTQWADAMDESIYEISYINSPEDAYLCLKRFFAELDKCMKMSTRVSRLVQNVLQYISLHAVDGVMLDDVASKFYVSPNYLSALIKKETGTTYQQHVLNAKIKVAKNMLDDTRMRVEEIAHAVGYENYISFYNAFKRIEGISPTEYRFRNEYYETAGNPAPL